MSRERIAFIGDAHLDRELPAVPEFVEFLHSLGKRCGTVVLMGDLFDLWIGDRTCQRDHHRQVVEALQSLRQQGVRTSYIEGNRDYRISSVADEAFDEIHESGAVFQSGGRRVFAIHGDRINRSDLAYRCWRGISKSAIAWRLFRAIPRPRRARFAEWLEHRMRSTNRTFKTTLPEEKILAYVESVMSDRVDAVVLGHFHVERHWSTRSGELFLLPEWKGSRRHLELDESGNLEWVDSTGS